MLLLGRVRDLGQVCFLLKMMLERLVAGQTSRIVGYLLMTDRRNWHSVAEECRLKLAVGLRRISIVKVDPQQAR